MSGRSPPLYCTLILITMHSHQSYSNITTEIHSYEYSTAVILDTCSTIEIMICYHKFVRPNSQYWRMFWYYWKKKKNVAFPGTYEKSGKYRY